MPFTVTTTLDDEVIKGLLCCAFEGGVKYWCPEICEYKFAKGLTMEDFQEGGKFQNKESYWAPCQIIPLIEGCAVICIEDCGEGDKPKKHRLDRKAIERGLRVMQDKCPKHWADVISDQTDAVTGDVFLQCALLGELVYG